MEEARLQIVGKALSAFSWGKLQEFANVLRVMKNNDYDPFEVIAYVDHMVQQQVDAGRRIEELMKYMPKCPECGHALYWRPLDPKKNVHGYRMHWFCRHGDCIYERYSVKEPQVELDENVIKVIDDGPSPGKQLTEERVRSLKNLVSRTRRKSGSIRTRKKHRIDNKVIRADAKTRRPY